MDMTVDEIIAELDNIMEAMSYHDERLMIALELASQLRDELMRYSDEDEDDE